MMSKIIAAFFLLSFCCFCTKEDLVVVKQESYPLPGNEFFPEGIAYNPETGIFYTGSVNNGDIVQVNVESSETKLFSAGSAQNRSAATGMKLDKKNRLWVCGGADNKIYVLNPDGSLIESWNLKTLFSSGFINDCAVDDVYIYFTDSQVKKLYRAGAGSAQPGAVEEWLSFTDQQIPYATGTNANGIVLTPDNKYLIIVLSNSGRLFRIDKTTKAITEIQLNTPVTSGDGLWLDESILYVSRNATGQIFPVSLNQDYTQGTVGNGFGSNLLFNTTIAKAGKYFLVVNGQLNRRPGITNPLPPAPSLPFTVSRVAIPKFFSTRPAEEPEQAGCFTRWVFFCTVLSFFFVYYQLCMPISLKHEGASKHKLLLNQLFRPSQRKPVSFSTYPLISRCTFHICLVLTFVPLKNSMLKSPASSFMKKKWWKILCVVLLVYTLTGGLLFNVPRLVILNETIRNLYFHVCMWFSMMILFTISVVQAVKYLNKTDLKYDMLSRQYAAVGCVFGVLGYATGSIWMSFTWADPNNPAVASFSSIAKEPKLIGAAIALLIYFAYFVLRGSIHDIDKRARISAVYNVFAFAFLFPSIWILPRLMESLHPGGQGNPALNPKDIDARMRLVFYPAVIGWTLLGVWIVSLKVRMSIIKEKKLLHT
jgi:ABC-type transport system involved in cytochrome c biogenesis permease subunit